MGTLSRLGAEPVAADPKAHPAAAIFPLMAADELAELAEDIRAHGQCDPIVMLAGQILDGRNRYDACRLAGVAPVTREHEGPESPAQYVVSKNIKRRHLTPVQRAALGAEIAPLFEAEAKERMKASPGRPPKGGNGSSPPFPEPKKRDESTRSIACAAKAVGAGKTATQALKTVRAKAPEVHALAKDGKINIAQAKNLADLPPKDREKAVTAIKAGAKPAAVLKGPPAPFDTGLAMLAFCDSVKREFAKWPKEDRRAFIHQLRQLAGELERKVNSDGKRGQEI